MEKIFDMRYTTPSRVGQEVYKMLSEYALPSGFLKIVQNRDGSITIRNYDKRRLWIVDHIKVALECRAKIEVMGQTTAVSYTDTHNNIYLGISHPSPKDEYDKDTGIAVAMAKAMNQPIPDYI